MTSAVRFVKPHAMSALWPMTTPGTPENPKPATSNAHASLTVRQRRPIWCHTLGSEAPRCGSLLSSGMPLAVSAPDTTHEFDPTPSPAPPSRADAASTTEPTSRHDTPVAAPALPVLTPLPTRVPAAAALAEASDPAAAGASVVIVGTITGWSA